MTYTLLASLHVGDSVQLSSASQQLRELFRGADFQLPN